MTIERYKYFTKRELMEANQRAIEAGCNSITLEYVATLPDSWKYPVIFQMPRERHGWVRCQVGTASSMPARDYLPVFLDVPQALYEALSIIEVQTEKEIEE